MEVRCHSCGRTLRNKNDISIVFEHCYYVWERDPHTIVFHILCRYCGTEVKRVEKEGKEAIELWQKLDQKISASAR
jgi:ribosomal protein S27E